MRIQIVVKSEDTLFSAFNSRWQYESFQLTPTTRHESKFVFILKRLTHFSFYTVYILCFTTTYGVCHQDMANTWAWCVNCHTALDVFNCLVLSCVVVKVLWKWYHCWLNYPGEMKKKQEGSRETVLMVENDQNVTRLIFTACPTLYVDRSLFGLLFSIYFVAWFPITVLITSSSLILPMTSTPF